MPFRFPAFIVVQEQPRGGSGPSPGAVPRACASSPSSRRRPSVRDHAVWRRPRRACRPRSWMFRTSASCRCPDSREEPERIRRDTVETVSWPLMPERAGDQPIHAVDPVIRQTLRRSDARIAWNGDQTVNPGTGPATAASEAGLQQEYPARPTGQHRAASRRRPRSARPPSAHGTPFGAHLLLSRMAATNGARQNVLSARVRPTGKSGNPSAASVGSQGGRSGGSGGHRCSAACRCGGWTGRAACRRPQDRCEA